MALGEIYFKVSRGKGDTLCTLEVGDYEENSLNIVASATGGQGFNIGSAVMKSMSLTLTRDGLIKMRDSGALRRKAKMSMYEDDGTTNVDKLLNAFYITDFTVSDYYAEITAYDIMVAFDKKLTMGDLIELRSTKRTPTNLVKWCCDKCRDDDYDINANLSPNHYDINKDILFRISDDSNIDTFRNCLEFVAGLIGSFIEVRFDVMDYTDGAVTPIKFSNTVRSDIEIEVDSVLGYTQDAFESIIARIETSIGGFDYSTANLIHDAKYDGIILSIYENPFLRGFVTEDMTALPQEAITAFNNSYGALQGMKFYGGSVEVPQRNDIQLGDRIKVKRKVIPEVSSQLSKSTTGGDIATEVVESSILVTDINWLYQNRSIIKCNASNQNRNTSSIGLNKGNGYIPTGGGGGGEIGKDLRIDEIADNLEENIGIISGSFESSARELGYRVNINENQYTYREDVKKLSESSKFDYITVNSTKFILDLCLVGDGMYTSMANYISDVYNGVSGVSSVGVIGYASKVFAVGLRVEVFVSDDEEITDESTVISVGGAGFGTTEMNNKLPYRNGGKFLHGDVDNYTDTTYIYDKPNSNISYNNVEDISQPYQVNISQLKCKPIYMHIRYYLYDGPNKSIGKIKNGGVAPFVIAPSLSYKINATQGAKYSKYAISDISNNTQLSLELYDDLAGYIKFTNNYYLDIDFANVQMYSLLSYNDNSVDIITNGIKDNSYAEYVYDYLTNSIKLINENIEELYNDTDESDEPTDYQNQIDELSDRVSAVETSVTSQGERITSVEGQITSLDSRVSQLEQGGSSGGEGDGTIEVAEYLNDSAIEISSVGVSTVTEIDIVSKKDKTPVVQFNMSASVSTSGLLEFILSYNNKELKFKPKVYVSNQYELISFSVPLSQFSEDKRATLSITCNNGGASIISQANMLSITILNATLPKPNNEFEYEVNEFDISNTAVLFKGAGEVLQTE